jgi:hypothetical protein
MECEQVKAHGGGIAQVAVAGNLICTTGYSSRSSNGYNSGYGNGSGNGGSGNKSNSSLYAFPDEHVLIFDIQYLCRGDKSTRRGGMPHPFNGLNGGPRFLSFLPRSQDPSGNCKVLVGSVVSQSIVSSPWRSVTLAGRVGTDGCSIFVVAECNGDWSCCSFSSDWESVALTIISSSARDEVGGMCSNIDIGCSDTFINNMIIKNEMVRMMM